MTSVRLAIARYVAQNNGIGILKKKRTQQIRDSRAQSTAHSGAEDAIDCVLVVIVMCSQVVEALTVEEGWRGGGVEESPSLARLDT